MRAPDAWKRRTAYVSRPPRSRLSSAPILRRLHKTQVGSINANGIRSFNVTSLQLEIHRAGWSGSSALGLTSREACCAVPGALTASDGFVADVSQSFNGKISLCATKAYVEAQAEFEECLKRWGKQRRCSWMRFPPAGYYPASVSVSGQDVTGQAVNLASSAQQIRVVYKPALGIVSGMI
jgi:hypothetical protein